MTVSPDIEWLRVGGGFRSWERVETGQNPDSGHGSGSTPLGGLEQHAVQNSLVLMLLELHPH